MTIKLEAQLLEQDALIELYELDLETFGLGIVRMHGYEDEALTSSISFNGNSYIQMPISFTGVSSGVDGPLARPTLTVGDSWGFYTGIIRANDDLLGAKFTIRRTYRKYLEDGSSPDGTVEFPQEVFYIERKAAQTKDLIEWELAVQFDVDDVKLPFRKILPNLCTWGYRSANCGYAGLPVADVLDNPTSDPELDDCSKRISGCKLRFGENGELPFGGFPAAGRF